MGLDKIEKHGSRKRKNINVLTPSTVSVKKTARYKIRRGRGGS